MFQTHPRIGRNYTAPIFVPSVAVIFCPALLAISRLAGLFVSFPCNGGCGDLTLAWVTWRIQSLCTRLMSWEDATPRIGSGWRHPRILNIPIVCAVLGTPQLFGGDLPLRGLQARNERLSGDQACRSAAVRGDAH
jgi:hypothetical protein